MSAVVVGNTTLRVTVTFDHAPDEAWGLYSWRTTSNSDIEVSGGSGAGLYSNYCDRDGCGPQDISWTQHGFDYWTGEITGSFDCTSDYSLYLTTGVSYEMDNPDYGIDPDALPTLQADGYGEAWADASPGNAVDCPSPVNVTEGDSGTTPAEVTIRLDEPPTEPLTVDWGTSDGTAKSGSDYEAQSGSLTFDVGETEKTVTVDVNGDRFIEPDESFFVNALDPSSTPRQKVTIVNDEPGVSVTAPATAEGDSGSKAVPVQVTLASPLPIDATLAYSTNGGSAASPGDYLTTSGTLRYSAGQVSKTFTVTINGDVDVEPDEVVQLTVSNADGQTVGSGSLNILDDDHLVSVSNPTVTEGDSNTTGMEFHVSLAGPYAIPVTLGYATAAQGTQSTASPGSDYIGASGSITFSPGDVDETITVTVLGDLIDEPDQTIGLVLTYPDGVRAASGTGTIADDDAPPTLTVGATSVREGTGTTSPNRLHFNVTLSQQSEFPISFRYQAVPGTSSVNDFFPKAGTVQIRAGEMTVTELVRVSSDFRYERDETVRLALSSPDHATVAPLQGEGTIVNDDLAPVLDVKSASVVEGNGGPTTLSFKVSVNRNSEVPASFSYTTVDQTATSSQSDYQPFASTATVPAGQASTIVNITVNGDTQFEPNETMKLIIGTPTDARITSASGKLTATGAIGNDDSPPTLSIDNVSASEGTGTPTNFTFAVSLSEPSGFNTRVGYATANATALAPADYTAKSGSVVIPAGQTTGTITIVVKGDALVEPDEQFVINLYNPLNATLGNNQATASIRNDD